MIEVAKFSGTVVREDAFDWLATFNNRGACGADGFFQLQNTCSPPLVPKRHNWRVDGSRAACQGVASGLLQLGRSARFAIWFTCRSYCNYFLFPHRHLIRPAKCPA